MEAIISPVLQLDHFAGFLTLLPLLQTANRGSQPWSIWTTEFGRLLWQGHQVCNEYKVSIRVVLPRCQVVLMTLICGPYKTKLLSCISNGPKCATKFRYILVI